MKSRKNLETIGFLPSFPLSENFGQIGPNEPEFNFGEKDHKKILLFFANFGPITPLHSKTLVVK